jgi:hypothetical protein
MLVCPSHTPRSYAPAALPREPLDYLERDSKAVTEVHEQGARRLSEAHQAMYHIALYVYIQANYTIRLVCMYEEHKAFMNKELDAACGLLMKRTRPCTTSSMHKYSVTVTVTVAFSNDIQRTPGLHSQPRLEQDGALSRDRGRAVHESLSSRGTHQTTRVVTV